MAQCYGLTCGRAAHRAVATRVGHPPVDRGLAGRVRDREPPVLTTGCAESAVATLTYQYARSVAWLDELSDDRDPHGYDLCERHAARLRVPHGWRLEERRPFFALAPAASSADASRSARPLRCVASPRVRPAPG